MLSGSCGCSGVGQSGRCGDGAVDGLGSSGGHRLCVNQVWSGVAGMTGKSEGRASLEGELLSSAQVLLSG